jgi:hypothetical protein
MSSPVQGSWPDIYYCLAVTVLFLWGALTNKRTGLSFVYAAGPCQRSFSRVRVLLDSRPYFTLSDLRLPFSAPPTTRRVTVEVFDAASTRGLSVAVNCSLHRIGTVHPLKTHQLLSNGYHGLLSGVSTNACPRNVRSIVAHSLL